MAIAYDTVSKGNIDGNSGSLTISHTCSGSDRLLVVATAIYDSTPSTVSGITYNGVALTKINHRTQTNSRAEMWYLLAPDTGTNNVVVFRTNQEDGTLDPTGHELEVGAPVCVRFWPW